MSGMIVLRMPIKLVSEANAHEHWRVRAKRASVQRTAARHALRTEIHAAKLTLPLRVRIVRIAPRSLDSDNAVGAAKHVRDGVADALATIGLRSDRDPRVVWTVDQESGAAREYAVRIEVMW